MTWPEFLNGIIRDPPSIFTLVVIAILTAHALDIALKFISNRRQPNALIITLELLVVIVLSYLVIDLHLEKPGEGLTNFRHEPFLLACLLVLFTLISSFVYILFKAVNKDHNEE